MKLWKKIAIVIVCIPVYVGVFYLGLVFLKWMLGLV